MSCVELTDHGLYKIGSSRPLSGEMLSDVAHALTLPPERKKRPFGGRGFVTKTKLPSLGSVVVKHYKRGGLLGLVNRRRYVHWGRLRPQIEFELLEQVRSLGVQAPEPLAFAVQGGLWYKGWLITRRVENERTLAEISVVDEDRTRRVMQRFVQQVALLMRNKIYHVDLHPGNVIVDENDNVFILDFDKAHFFKYSKNRLRDRYLCRWRRAVIKHRLPELLSELMCAELRKNYDRE